MTLTRAGGCITFKVTFVTLKRFPYTRHDKHKKTFYVLLTRLVEVCYIYTMSKIMQDSIMADFRVRNIPEADYRFLKAMAALSGQSVNEYILALLKAHVAEKKGNSGLGR